jgi:uncharacterized protein (TIGR02231 family)
MKLLCTFAQKAQARRISQIRRKDFQMRALLPLCAVTILADLTLPSQADQLQMLSRIEAVTVFPDGALVTREADVEVAAGASELMFRNLPNDLDATSLRVSGMALSELAIDSVFTRLAPGEKKPDGASEAQLKELKSQREQVQAALDSLQAKKAMAMHFAEAEPKELASDTKPLSVSEWPLAFDTVAAALLKTGDDMRIQGEKARELDAAITVPEQVIAGGNGNREPRREVHVQVHASAASKGRIALTYRVVNAGWRPIYDARLDTNNAGHKPSLNLVRRASVSQRTGEDWDDVALTVSTVRASRSTTAPSMETQRLAFLEYSAAKNLAPAPPTLSQRHHTNAPAEIAALPASDEQPAQKPVAETMSQPQAGDFQASFLIPGRIRLAADSVTKTFAIGSRDIAPDLIIKTVPALDQTAYLQGHFVNEDEAPLLPGEVALYRNGSYVGTGMIGFVAPGDDLDLGFGADDRVKIARLPVKRKENEPSWFAQSRAEAREYKTSVKNLHDFPVKIVLLDQVPISENTAITVEQLPATTPPTEKTVADKRGVMSWTYDYAPGQSREIHLAYRMKWPSDREVVTEQVSALGK